MAIVAHRLKSAFSLSMTLLLAVVVVAAVAPPDQPLAAPVPAARQAERVAIVVIDRPIDAVMSQSVARRMKQAEEEGAGAIVFELDTPGGEVGAALEICNLIKQSSVKNTVAWVHPDAYSAGTLIALACREIVVGEYATMGDAFPIRLDHMQRLDGMPEAERQKILTPLVAEVVDSARRRGYDEKLVQGFVALGVELWLIENIQTGQRLFIGRDEHRMLFGEPAPDEPVLVPSAPPAHPQPALDAGLSPAATDGPADPITATPDGDLAAAAPALEAIGRSAEFQLKQEFPRNRPTLTAADAASWRKVAYVSRGTGPVTLKTEQAQAFGLASAKVTSQEDLKSFFGASYVGTLRESWSERGAYHMSNWVVRGILIAVFLIALFVEIVHPGLIAPGALAAISLLGLIAPSVMYNMATWWEVAAILVGILCLMIEVFVLPGFGICGIAGVLLLFGGLIGAFSGGQDPLFPNPDRDRDMLYGVVTVLLSVTTAGVAMYLIGRNLKSMPGLGRLVLHSTVQTEPDMGLLAAMDSGQEVSIGDVGRALTPLRPAGRVRFGERMVDVVTVGEMIPSGVAVRVVQCDQFRVVVEAVSAST